MIYPKKKNVFHTSLTSITIFIDCCPWKVIKYIGNFSNSLAHRSNSFKCSSNGCPDNCRSSVEARRVFRISNDPHNVLTPFCVKSNEYSDMNVVLPQPVGPVKMVSSPLRCPFSNLFKTGNRDHFTPCTLSTFWISLNTSWRKDANVVIALCSTGWARAIIARTSSCSCAATNGDGCDSVGRTKTHRFSLSFFAKFLAVSQLAVSLWNHKVRREKRSSAGKHSCGSDLKPWGRQTIAAV